MGKILGTFAAHERFDLQRPEFGPGVDTVVAQDIEVIHGCGFPEEPREGIWAMVADATGPIFAKPCTR